MRDVNWFVPLLGLIVYALAHYFSSPKVSPPADAIHAAGDGEVIAHRMVETSAINTEISPDTAPTALSPGKASETRLVLVMGTLFALVFFAVWIIQRITAKTLS